MGQQDVEGVRLKPIKGFMSRAQIGERHDCMVHPT